MNDKVKVYVTSDNPKVVPGHGMRVRGEYFEFDNDVAEGYLMKDGFSKDAPSTNKTKRKEKPPQVAEESSEVIDDA